MIGYKTGIGPIFLYVSCYLLVIGLTHGQNHGIDYDSQDSENILNLFFDQGRTNNQPKLLSYNKGDLILVARKLMKILQYNADHQLDLGHEFPYTVMMAHAILDKMEQSRTVPTKLVKTVNLYYYNIMTYNSTEAPEDAATIPSMKAINSNICNEGSCQVPITLSGIWGYGCWCNFGYNLLEGQGKPVNEYDNICKKMQMCLRCSRLDGKTDGHHCNPKTQNYNADFGWMPGNEAILADCTLNNPEDVCAQHVCSCELALINDLLNLMWSGVIFDAQFKHVNGWNPNEDGKCEATASGDGRLKSCCGWYPDRSPYGGDIECCEDVQARYNPYVHTCCGKLGVFGIGTGCE